MQDSLITQNNDDGYIPHEENHIDSGEYLKSSVYGGSGGGGGGGGGGSGGGNWWKWRWKLVEVAVEVVRLGR